jgi:AcrR family transcriptional regulator
MTEIPMTDDRLLEEEPATMPRFAAAFDHVPREASDAKHRVKTAALALFSERSFPDVSVRDIMNACGLTSGALYAHYKSKEEVLFCLIQEGHERLHVRLETLFKLRGDPAQRLARLAYVHMLFQLKNLPLARVASSEFRYLPQHRQQELNKLRLKMADYFDATIQQGVDAGLFDVSIPFQTRMMILIGANLAPQWYDPQGEASAETIAAWHADMALRITMTKGTAATRIRAIAGVALQVMEDGWESILSSRRHAQSQDS